MMIVSYNNVNNNNNLITMDHIFLLIDLRRRRLVRSRRSRGTCHMHQDHHNYKGRQSSVTCDCFSFVSVSSLLMIIFEPDRCSYGTINLSSVGARGFATL